MKQLTVEEKVFLVIYSRSHNIDETMRVYGVSRATVTRYKKKYDGTEESLVDKRTSTARKDSFSQEEKAQYIDLLIEFNKPNVKRLNLAPIITTLHSGDLQRKTFLSSNWK